MLNKVNRLKKRYQFNYIYKNGKYINSSNFTVNYVDTYFRFPKFGISVSKKLGNSVMRSRTKRVMTEIIRLNIGKIVNKNFVIVLKPSFALQTYSDLEKEFSTALKKAKLLKEQPNE